MKLQLILKSMKIGDNDKMFKVGDKVVCVDITTDFGTGLPQYLKLNDIYIQLHMFVKI